jgi:hypothetical protein
MKHFKLFTVLVVCIGVFSVACKKETPAPVANPNSPGASTGESDCPPVVWPDSTLQILIGWTPDRKRMPHFNPANNNQFSFTAAVPGSNLYDLCVHDLSTGVTEVILQGHTYFYQPRWHANGWILFRGNGDNVYRIKSNGDSLLQITAASVYQTPIWRPDGQAWISNNVVDFSGDIDVFDLEGNLIEVIPGEEFNFGDWSQDNRIITHRPNNFGPHQMAWTDAENVSWQLLDFDTVSPQMSVKDIKWIPMSDEVMFSQHVSDISKINIFTGQVSMVREGCGNRHYEYFSINYNCTKIIAERVTIEDFYSNGIHNILILRSDIVLMNFDGTGEEVIELP